MTTKKECGGNNLIKNYRKKWEEIGMASSS